MMNDEQLHIVIISKASLETGLGHLSRCLTLHKAFIKQGVKCQLWINDHEMPRAFLSDFSFNVYPQNSAFNFDTDCDLCIVDLYCYETEFYKQLTTQAKNIVIFDDNQFIVPHCVSGVINVNAYANPQCYDTNAQIFAGLKYALIKEDFFQYNWQPKQQRILVCTGGSDPEQQTKRWVQCALKQDNEMVDVILGPGYEWENGRKWLMAQARVNCFEAPDCLAKIASQTQLVVVAAGTLLTEMLALGMPSISITLAENQKSAAEYYHQNAATSYIGAFDQFSDQKLEDDIKQLSQSTSKQQELSDQAKSLVKNNGAECLAQDLLNWVRSNDL